MGEIPVDAARALDELRELRGEPWPGPRSWLSPELFHSALEAAEHPPAKLEENLAFLHGHWSLAGSGAGGRAGGLRRRLGRLLLGPLLAQIEQYMATSVRALDALARRVDELEENELRILGAARHDLVSLARFLEESLDERR